MIVCQCLRVSADAALDAAANGCHHVRDVVRATKAGTDCGGCLPALRVLCEESRRAQEGVAVTVAVTASASA